MAYCTKYLLIQALQPTTLFLYIMLWDCLLLKFRSPFFLHIRSVLQMIPSVYLRQIDAISLLFYRIHSNNLDNCIVAKFSQFLSWFLFILGPFLKDFKTTMKCK